VKVTQDHLGHCSLEGLRKYEHMIFDRQNQEACKALTNDKILHDKVKVSEVGPVAVHNDMILKINRTYNQEVRLC